MRVLSWIGANKLKVLPALLFILFLMLFFTGARDKTPRVTKEELLTMLGKPDVIVIDVRLGATWKESDVKIKGAVREDPARVSSWINNYAKDKTLVFY